MAITQEDIYNTLSTVTDPEIPVLTILDLGIVRDVKILDTDSVSVVITPTYSGCPAMDVIAMNIRLALTSLGIRKVEIEHQISPAWTTDWMSEIGKSKLKAYGIAPPQRMSSNPLALFEKETATCPRCGAENTQQISQFGATSCKALYKCMSCQEPFEYFKCH